MRKILFTVVSLLICTVLQTKAQTNVEEPEYELEAYLMATDSTLGQPLPLENAYIKAKAAASMFIVGIGKAKSYYYVNGTASPLKVKQSDYIVINTGGKSPLQTLTINRFEILKSKRRFQNGQIGTFTGAQYGTEGGESFKYKKYGKDSVKIPLKDLQPGEYSLMVTNKMTDNKSAKIYTFCVE
ncbi:MAG: hypothetical protein J6I54_03485 [Bacteroidaceae bacterium]|nr:hypothetical protein [Bacteroidaceae bacterium]